MLCEYASSQIRPISLLTQTICCSLIAAFVKLMSVLETSKRALDPSWALECLNQIISKAENPSFNSFSQQNTAEIL